MGVKRKRMATVVEGPINNKTSLIHSLFQIHMYLNGSNGLFSKHLCCITIDCSIFSYKLFNEAPGIRTGVEFYF